MGFLLEPERAVIMRGPMLHGIIQQFLHQVDWGQLDYLVIDLPPGTGDVPLTLAQSLPLTGAVVVCTPQEVALLDAVRAISMFRQLKVPILGMVENMSGPIFGRGGAQRKAVEMGIPALGEVPLEVSLRELGDAGKLASALDPGSPARPYLLGVVEQLAAQISIQNLKAGFEAAEAGDPLVRRAEPVRPSSTAPPGQTAGRCSSGGSVGATPRPRSRSTDRAPAPPRIRATRPAM